MCAQPVCVVSTETATHCTCTHAPAALMGSGHTFVERCESVLPGGVCCLSPRSGESTGICGCDLPGCQTGDIEVAACDASLMYDCALDEREVDSCWPRQR